MNNECNAVHISAAGSTYRCTLYSGHSGHHKRMNASRTYTFYHWPQAEPPNCPARHQGWKCTLHLYHSGNHEAHGIDGNLYHRWSTPATVPEQIKAAHPSNWSHIVDEELSKVKVDLNRPEENPVLLTLEDLKTISYYLPFYTDDAEDQDNITKAKIDAALKKML